MANDTKTNTAGDMVINIEGRGGSHGHTRMGCGCYNRCGCGQHTHGSDHGHGGNTHIVKTTTNTIHGDEVATQACGDTSNCSDDVSLATGSVNEETGLVTLTLSNGAEITIDMSAFLGGGGNGTNGADGDSAYDLWLAAGNTGTVADFLASLVGPQGPQGEAGSGGGGTTVSAVTSSPLSGDGTSSSPITLTAAEFATWLGVNGNAAACDAILACVANARVIGAGVEQDALDDSALVLVLDAAGNPAFVPASAVTASGGSSSSGLNPYSSGQNPADWLFAVNGAVSGGTTVNMPAGPTSSGYWHIESIVTQDDLTFTGGAVYVSSAGFAQEGDGLVFTPAFGGGGGGNYEIYGRWIAT